MSAPQHLTLGALYHEMRNGLGDHGWARLSIEFQQRSSSAPVAGGGRAQPGELSKRVLGADLDYEDQVMHGAAVFLGGTAPRPEASFSIQRHLQGYAYSLDGESWGRFAAKPQVFDLSEFEQELGHVPVRDATIEQALQARRLNEALDLDLESASFERLLRIFSADRQDEREDLGLAAFSVTLAGGEDVSLLYWWSLTGFEREPRPDEPGFDTYAAKITCSVTIRLSGVEPLERRKLKLDKRLPEVAHLDEVWALLRNQGAGAAAV